MSADEATEATGWLLHLGDRFPEAAALIVKTPAGLSKHSDLLYRLKDSALVAKYPHYVAELVTDLARRTEPPFWGCSFLEAIVGRVRPTVERARLIPLVEEALRLGCASAPAWLEE